jgi:bifunctional UDP-N-acetylglucosamine pyrophosphorylase/glucosamine-1-phosphate N-acetyltransferase
MKESPLWTQPVAPSAKTAASVVTWWLNRKPISVVAAQSETTPNWGQEALIDNASLGDRVEVVQSVVRDARVGDDVSIGPFAHLRPAAEVGNGCRIGNFVEVKKSRLGAGSKVNHLSYIGDASLGENVNVGAGTITANYDGVNKHQTVIGDHSKTGANSVLVAPVTIGDHVTIGAGSTITKDVPSKALSIGRARQMTKDNWANRST